MSVFSKRTALALMSSTALTAVVASVPATAQDGPVIEEILVTAQRREQSILDIPYNISVVSGADIEDNVMLDTTELLRSVPGIGTVDRGPRNAGTVNSIRIRGLNIDSSALGDYAVSGIGTVSTYLNDTPIFANMLMKDIKRVEILRGPQGTLYGSGALGGTVRFIAREPVLGEFAGYSSLTLSKVEPSSDHGTAVDLTLNIPVGEKAALRLVGSRGDYPGMTDYVNVYKLDNEGVPVAPGGVLSTGAEYEEVEDADTYDVEFLRASFLWEPTESFSMLASYTTQEDDIGGRRAQTRGLDGWGEAYDDYENGSIQLEPMESQVEVMSLEATLDLGFATLTSSTSEYEHTGSSISENTGFYAQAGWLAWYYTYPRPMAQAQRSYSDEAFVQELRLVSNGSGDISYVAGLFYMDQTLGATQDSFLVGAKAYIDAFNGFDVPWVSGDQDWMYIRSENFEETALYGEITYHASEKVDLTVGARQFWNDSSIRTFMSLPFWTALFPDVDVTFNNEESDLLLKANMTYRINEENMVYATVSEGFRRGGANGVPTEGFYAESPLWQEYDADSVVNYELGIKGTRHGIRYNVSGYVVDWDNIQLNTATPTWGFFVVQNGAGAKTQGVEIELDGNLTDALHYNFGYTYTDATLRSPLYSATGVFLAPDGDALPGAPEHMLNVALDHTKELNSDWTLVTRLSGFYQSDSENVIGESASFSESLDGFGIWNASATFTKEDAGLTFWIKNIGNEEGVTGVFKEEFMGTLPAANYYGNASKELISLPRTFGFTLAYSF